MPSEIERYTGGITATNGYFSRTNQGSFAIDAPEGFAAWLTSQGAKIEALILTHAHFDHVLDAAAIQQQYQCPIYAFAVPSPGLTLEVFLRSMDSSLRVPLYEVQHLLKDGDSFTVAGRRFQSLHIPGHSIDSLAFYDAEEGTVYSGDTVMSFSIGRSDFPGGNQELLIQGIQEKILTLPDHVRLYPGHGAITTVGEERLKNPYLS